MTDLHANDSRKYAVHSLCRLFGVSKQAYYKYDQDAALAKAARTAFVVEYVKEVRNKDRGIGGRLLYVKYKNEFGPVGDTVGRDVFYRIIDENGLKLRRRTRSTPRTTDSTHGLPTFPNLVWDFIPTAPNQLWVSDITYIKIWLDTTRYAFCYLSLIMDAYTKEILGWSVGPDLSATYPIEALRMALERLENKSDESRPIHHSDRGVQYASADYLKLLNKHHLKISMTETGNPKDNSQAERINSTMKNELLKGVVFRSIDEVRAAVSEAVCFYNNERPHSSIDFMAPAQAAKCSGPLKKHWHSYREAAIEAAQKKNDGSCDDNTEKCLPLQRCQGFPSGLRPSVNP